MSYGAGATGDSPYGWFPSSWFGGGEQREDRASFDEMAEWAREQIQRADSGGTYTGYADIKPAGWSGTPSSLQESATNTMYANFSAAYWLAGAAQEGRHYGWSESAVNDLVSAAELFFDAGTGATAVVGLVFGGSSDQSISAIYTEAGQVLARIAASQPPIKSYKTYLLKFQQMGDLDSIQYNKDIADASHIGAGEAIVGTTVGTVKDILGSVGIGDGGALHAQAERDKMNRDQQRANMRPYLITAAVLGGLYFGYLLLKPEDSGK